MENWIYFAYSFWSGDVECVKLTCNICSVQLHSVHSAAVEQNTVLINRWSFDFDLLVTLSYIMWGHACWPLLEISHKKVIWLWPVLVSYELPSWMKHLNSLMQWNQSVSLFIYISFVVCFWEGWENTVKMQANSNVIQIWNLGP